MKRKVRLAISQRRNLPQFTYKRNEIVKSLKRNIYNSDEEELPVTKIQVLDNDDVQTEELKEILECEVITDFTPEDNSIQTNSDGCNTFV